MKRLLSSARQLIMLSIVFIVFVVPFTSGVVNAILPGSGVSFNEGFIGLLGGLPEAFWAFAGLVAVGHQASRAFTEHKEAAAIEAYANAAAGDPALPPAAPVR